MAVPPQDEHDPAIWRRVWDDPIEDYEWDYLGQVILDTLLEEAGSPAGRRYIEVGSGSGRISARLAALGAETTLLDYQERALALSRTMAEGQGIHHAAYLHGSMFDIPAEEESFDVVWNAGVIEHYPFPRQVTALAQMRRVLKCNGVLVTLNPYAGSLLHSLGKWLITRFIEYPFGDEVPIATCAGMAQGAHLALDKEYSVGFVVLWVGAVKRLMLLPGGRVLTPLLTILNEALVSLDRSRTGPALRRLDRLLSRHLGGYLIVSVMHRA
jgi:SAM-dependent methyltransferase